MKDYISFSKVLRCVFCIVLFSGVVVISSGCGTTKEPAPVATKNTLTYGMVKKHVIKGVTTQEELLKLFGGPNIITKNKAAEEVWTYDKMSISSRDIASALELGAGIPGARDARIGGGVASATSTTSTSSMTLIITFASDNIVKEYSVMAQEF